MSLFYISLNTKHSVILLIYLLNKPHRRNRRWPITDKSFRFALCSVTLSPPTELHLAQLITEQNLHSILNLFLVFWCKYSAMCQIWFSSVFLFVMRYWHRCTSWIIIRCGSWREASKGTSKMECKREAFKDKPKTSSLLKERVKKILSWMASIRLLFANRAHGVMLNFIKTFLRMQPWPELSVTL